MPKGISYILEVIVDYRSLFVNYGNEMESKGVQFPVAEMPLIKLIGAANRQSLVIGRKFLPLCHRNTRLGCVLTNAKTQMPSHLFSNVGSFTGQIKPEPRPD